MLWLLTILLQKMLFLLLEHPRRGAVASELTLLNQDNASLKTHGQETMNLSKPLTSSYTFLEGIFVIWDRQYRLTRSEMSIFPLLPSGSVV